ncbi:MAG: phosphoglycerate dehydrogenase [Longimicrobiales bacterium]
MPKILVSDELSPKGIAILQAAEGIEVDVKTGMPPEELIALIPDYHGLVIRSTTKVTDEVIAAAANMKVIGRAGIGVDNVALEAASTKGIIVMNTPGGNTITTAEHAIAMLMALSRNIPQADHSMKEGKWEKKQFIGVEVFNKTLGVIGLGRVGSIVAQRALGLQMKVVTHDPYIARDVAEKIGVELVEFDDLLARSDYISLHAAKTKDTEGLIGAGEFAKMKNGVFLINCARGSIVEEEALFEALESGKVAGAALDVFSIEPTPPDNPLVNHPRVICTPHLGASTGEAQENVAIAIAEQVVGFFVRGEVKNAVNTPSLDAEVVSLLGPYLNLAGRLGSFAAQYVDGGIKEVKIRYAGEEIARGTTPLTLYVLAGVLQTFMEEAVNTVNAPYLVKQRGIVVNESTTRATEDYTNLITVELVTDKGRGTVSGTIFGRKNPRIVRIDEVSLEAMPEGPILVFSNRDTPGVIGRVGTILGNNKINIAGIQLGRTAPQEDAVAVLNVDQPVNESVIAELLALPNLYYAKTITL